MESGPRPSPPTPGLVAENTRRGFRLFRYRSYAPLLPLAYILVLAWMGPVPPGGAAALAWWQAAGLFLGFLGLTVRAWTLGAVPEGTSGRTTAEPRAESLNTAGAYSIARHPLYLGNLLLWMGVAVLSGHPLAILVTPLVFWLYYEKIMLAEERFLHERFGADFEAWAARTPAVLPRGGSFVRDTQPFSLRLALMRDYQGLYGFVAATTAVEVARSLGSGDRGRIDSGWWLYFALGTLAYFGLHALKRYVRRRARRKS